MSIVKKMNQELKSLLGRDPTIHEQIDILILSVVKERIKQLQLAYEMNPIEEYKEDFIKTVGYVTMIHARNPEIFVFNDSEGDDEL